MQLTLSFAAFLWSFPMIARAQEGIIASGIEGCDFTTGSLKAACIPSFIAHLIQFLFGLTGVFCLINIMIAGYQIAMGAITGDKEQGKRRLTWAILGFIMSVCAFLILDVAIYALLG